MSSHLDAIKRVVEAFERSGWSEIDVRSGDVRVHLSTGALSAPSVVEPDGRSRPAEVAATTAVGAGAEDDGAAHPVNAAPSGPVPAGAHLVVSPSPGIFWRSPEPGAPPFADVGDVVEASATVCIVEVMKLMNHLKAGVRGEVVAVYGENGAAVRKGDPLFAITPSGLSL